eukprot:TRINITY_DN1003_c0_g2_i1.p1 TRINITY_DN1003_c0_g2~~TRINITY_DN1003_c0_g2_i1.p1  ORF type:complete len:300 (+),score=81.45 TRINITY_DN1003_c0_g2_i1:64-963(+)
MAAQFDSAKHAGLLDDLGLKLMGYERGMPVRGWSDMYVAPAVGCVLIACAFVLHAVLSVVVRSVSLNSKPETPSREEFPKQAAFCLLGVLIHSWLGRVAYFAALAGEDMPPHLAVGNKAALSENVEWRDLYNVYSLLGEFFAGYTVYITTMWLLGWEKGVDKIIHHVVFAFLAHVLAGTGGLGRLSAEAMAMESSTVFLNSAIMFGWFSSSAVRLFSKVCGALFVLNFLYVRIYFFGKGLVVQWSQVDSVRNDSPMSEAMAITCLVLFTAGWGIQVYWLRPIYHKVVDTFAGSKKGKDE